MGSGGRRIGASTVGIEMIEVSRARTLAVLALFAWGCAGGANESSTAAPDRQGATGEERAASCPATSPAPHPLPGVSEEQLSLDYWLARASAGELDEPLLTPEQIATHNRALTSDAENGLPIDRGSLAAPPPAERLVREVRERLTYLRERVSSGEYVAEDGSRLDEDAAAALSEVALRPEAELRIATGAIPLRCGPRREGLFKLPVDTAFDRNNCSTIRPQEPVQVLMRWPNGMLLARTRYSLGWIPADAPLSPPVPEPERAIVLTGSPMRVPAGTRLAAADGATLAQDGDVLLPRAGDDHVLFADESGLHRASHSGLISTARPLTRRAVLEEAFRRIDHPYGWGDQAGGLDCSRFVMDILATFGLELPRHSGRQAASGTHTIDVSELTDLDERQRLIDAASRRGIVLLHFPGHIMLYLGRDADDTPRVIHSFSEYAEACEGGETLRRVDRVTVSDLTLGRGSSRRSFLERLDRIVILGQTMGPELIGVASPRRALPVEIPSERACDDSLRVRIFSSPERPNSRQPLRVFVTATEELGPVELALVDPSGRRHAPETRRLGGPPFTYWTQIDTPAPGRWTVALGDGANVAACDRIGVAGYPSRPQAAAPEVVWTPRLRWEADTEALFSAFVEQLFDYPADEDLTWPNLTVLLQDRSRNILYNHLGQDEEERIRLQPDCADLPYFLRTYFAWKMRLPFGFRTCTRGRRGELPTCGDLEHPGIPHEQGTDEVEAFRWFIGQRVKHGVHSASGRTHPEDSLTALYPVPMTREALRPGTVFADPYGHLLVIARWIPQGAGDRYGILVGADAQPDGTVGRRRFWRGTFLFDPDTTHVGAGFKAWRPVLYDRVQRTYESLPNERITARAGYVPFSMQQYEGTTDQYYERMEAIINPRPLDAWRVQRSLIDALAESAARRVVSVQNGEDWKTQNPGDVMEMPEGGAIFLTAGPWEEYSTPARDMRMLVAMDTVMGFVDVLRRDPARFGVRPEDVDAAVGRVEAQRTAELERRTFTYRRSDGRDQTVTLAQLIQRMRAFEMAYNPNDCVELRWGAPEGSPELRSCARHAPADQRARMAEYREWFATRRRPLY